VFVIGAMITLAAGLGTWFLMTESSRKLITYVPMTDINIEAGVLRATVPSDWVASRSPDQKRAAVAELMKALSKQKVRAAILRAPDGRIVVKVLPNQDRNGPPMIQIPD
jgi:hypothetical protein